MINFKNLRPPANYPVYPPYHQGEYLEEYFYKFYLQHKEEFDKTGYTLIPIFWTNVYNTQVNRHLIQPYLNALPAGKYFTVSQHDDAVTEILPEGTLSFEAGGNKNGISIPLICSQLPNVPVSKQRDLFCSFVGSITSPIRQQLYNMLSSNFDYTFYMQNWTPTISNSCLDLFINTTLRSKFALCPRGYGAQSFRLYEVLQLGAIPVIVYDKDWFPFESELDWDTFAVKIHISDIPQLDSILRDIDPIEQNDMRIKGQRVYRAYFTLENTCRHILKILQ